MQSIDLIKKLIDDKFIIWNVNENKMPILPNGISWSKCSHNEAIKNIKLDNDAGFGIRTGQQENNKYIIGLDFDIYIKINGVYEQCINTRKLLKEFETLNPENKGLFISSTEGNRGCLIDITNCQQLIELIELDGRRKIQKQNYCLEVLTSFNMVLPPTKTICKIRKLALTNREFLNPEYPFLELEENTNIHNFIYKYIEEAGIKNKISSKTLKKYNKEVNYLNLIDDIENNTNLIDIDDKNMISFLKLLSQERINNYNTWMKIGLSLKNVYEDDKIGFEVFNKWSQIDKNSYDKLGVMKYWELWNSYKNKYTGLNLSYILSCVNLDNPDKFYIAYCEYLQIKKNNDYNKKKANFEKEVIKVLEPQIYLNYNKYLNNWGILSYQEIEHKYFEKYGKTFLNQYYEDETKNYYDIYDFIPDNNKKATKDNLKIFNSFTGFNINSFEKTEVNCDIIIEHIKKMCGNNSQTYEYFIQWLAHLLFNTTKRCFKVPVLKGEEGTGKSTIYNIIERIIGKKYCLMTSTPENDIFSRFNDLLHEKIFININEAEFNSFQRTMENFKSLIADTTYNMESKGKRKITLNNYMWFFITTNNDKLFNISASNRRFFFIECDTKIANNKDYFNELYQAIENDNVIYSFYKYIENLFNPNYNFDEGMQLNKTDYQKVLEVNSKQSFYLFLNELLENESEDFIYKKANEIFTDYKRYCLNSGDAIKETGKSIKLKMTLLNIDYSKFRINGDNPSWYYKINKDETINIMRAKNLI